jgi:hypothetical protein
MEPNTEDKQYIDSGGLEHTGVPISESKGGLPIEVRV